MQRTFIIFKPDCMAQCHVGNVLNRFENAGFTIIGAKMMRLTPALFNDHDQTTAPGATTMSNPLLIKTRLAEAAILPNTIVKSGASDGSVLTAAAATDGLVGVMEGPAPTGAAIGERCEVTMVGIAEVKLGGSVTRDGPVTSNATGQGVAAALGNRIIGFACNSGVSGDVIEVLLAPGVF